MNNKLIKIMFGMIFLFIFVNSVNASIFGTTLNDGLTTYYSFESNVTNLIDMVGGKINGTFEGDPLVVKGKVNNSLNFNAVDQGVIIGSALSFNTNGTISVWIYQNTSYNLAILGSGSNNNIYVYTEDATTIDIQGTSGTIKQFTVPEMSIKTWYNLVITNNGTSGTGTRVYLNGVESSTGNQTTTFTSFNKIGIYSDGSNGRFNGSIDEFGLWNRTLNSTEIAALYNSGTGIGYYEDYYPPADTTNPLINYGVGTEINTTNVSRYNIYVNTTWTETNFANITFNLYYINGTIVNSTTYDTPIYLINWTNLNSAKYIYNVSIRDLTNNFNETDTRVITLDRIYPTWSNNNTNLSSTTILGDSAYFNITLTDVNPGSYIFSFYNGTNWTNTTGSYVSGRAIEIIKTINSAVNTINWSWYFNDTSGNENHTIVYNIFYTTTSTPTTPEESGILTGSGGDITTYEIFYFNTTIRNSFYNFTVSNLSYKNNFFKLVVNTFTYNNSPTDVDKVSFNLIGNNIRDLQIAQKDTGYYLITFRIDENILNSTAVIKIEQFDNILPEQSKEVKLYYKISNTNIDYAARTFIELLKAYWWVLAALGFVIVIILIAKKIIK